MFETPHPWWRWSYSILLIAFFNEVFWENRPEAYSCLFSSIAWSLSSIAKVLIYGHKGYDHEPICWSRVINSYDLWSFELFDDLTNCCCFPIAGTFTIAKVLIYGHKAYDHESTHCSVLQVVHNAPTPLDDKVINSYDLWSFVSCFFFQETSKSSPRSSNGSSCWRLQVCTEISSILYNFCFLVKWDIYVLFDHFFVAPNGCMTTKKKVLGICWLILEDNFFCWKVLICYLIYE